MRHAFASLFTLVLISSPVVAYGQTVTAMWDPSPPSDQVTSYQVCISATSMSCNVQLASVSDPQTTYTFTPTPGVVHYVAIRAINSVGAGSYSTETLFSIPSFIQPVNQSSPAGVAITPLNMSVTDPDGSARNFTHTGLPTGLALNATTGQITGTPSAAGTYNVTIFVTDPLVTVSRSFVWTITALVADTTAPALTITSHTNGQTLSTASVTISGTASDSGRGGNGVSVTVNGQAATGGSATGSVTASWSRKLTLAQGANTITVQATDGRGNIATQSITLNNSSAPVTSVALTSTVASPQNTGTAITFIANSSGGVAPVQFKFLVQPAGGAAQVVQDWSAATTYTWTPATAGTHTVILWARSAGVTADAAQASAQMAYVVNTPPAPVTSATLTSTAASPQNSGTAITFTATSSGGVASHQYKFLLSQDGGAAQGVRDWSTAPTYTWTPPTAGTYTMIVWARSAGVTVDAPQASAQMAYVVNTPPPALVTSVALTPNQASPQGTGNPITFSAAASGGIGPQQYKFLLQPTGGAAQVVQNWGTATTYTWTPAATGDHTVTVWARSAGVTVDAAQASAQVPYSVIASGVNAVSVLPSSGSGSAQTFTLAYSDSRGASNLISEWVWISGGTATCMVYHERATNRVYLLNDAGTAWTSKMLGSSSILQGSSCAINLGSSSASASGSVLTLNLAIAFTPAFSGEKTIRMFANAAGGLSSGWQDRGSWTVPASAPAPTDRRKRRKTTTETSTSYSATEPTPTPAPTTTIQSGVQALSVTPASGSGSSATFVMQYADSRGARNLVAEWVWFSGGTGMCMIYHERVTNTVYLINDAGSAWHTGLIRSATTLQNGSCAVNLGNSTVSIDGPVLTLNLAISFKAPFTGTKNIAMFASALDNLSTGWQNRGTWIVP